MARVGRGLRSLVVVGLAAAALTTVLTGAAAGAPPTEVGYVVDGSGVLTDDFDEHRTELGNSLCYGCADSQNTNLVVMWQAFLYAEGLLPYSGIDGKFGPQTRDATKAWQRRFGLTADGLVGNATWDKADGRLIWHEGSPLYDAKGSAGAVLLARGSGAYGSGAYQLRWAHTGAGSTWIGFTWDKIYFDMKTVAAYPF